MVFLSYERCQEPLARALCEALRAAGWSVFFDLDSLESDHQLDERLHEAGMAATHGLVVGQQGWGASAWASGEYALLLGRWEAGELPLVVVVPAGGGPPGSPPTGVPLVEIDAENIDLDAVVDAFGRSKAPLPAGVGPGLVARFRAAVESGRDAEAAQLALELDAVEKNSVPRRRLAFIREALQPLLRASRDADFERLVREGWALAASLTQPRAELASDLALVLERRGDPEAELWWDRAEEFAREEGSAELLDRLVLVRANAANRRGAPRDALALLDRVEATWTPGQAPSQAMHLRLARATALRLDGQESAARQLLEELRFLARSRRDAISEAAAVFELGVLVDDGDPARALVHYQASLGLSREAKDRFGVVRAAAQLTVHHASRGRCDDARRWLAEAEALDPTHPHTEWARSWVERAGEQSEGTAR